MNRNTLILSFIVALRFFGLFVVMPLLSLYAMSKMGSDKFLVGIVMGGYAASQLVTQIPFGLASDKFGRKKIIVFGLLIFAIGSIVCAVSSDIYWLITGRLLQGAGAISSVVTAMISDFTKEEKRAKAFAAMGGAIAVSFMAAMVIGPYIGGHYGVDLLFWLTSGLAILAALILLFAVPEAPRLRHHAFEEKPKFKELFTDKNLVRMYINMLLHGFLLSIVFMLIPIEMTEKFHWAQDELWKVYVLAMGVGFLAMAPAAIAGEKYGKIREVFIIAVFLNAISFVCFGFSETQTLFIAGILIFFIGFNMLEPLLQSTTSKYAKASQRGSALAVFTSFQYLGVFLGGAIGGLILHALNVEILVVLMVVVSLLWLVYNFQMVSPPKAGFLYLALADFDNSEMPNLTSLNGVFDSYVNETEGTLVIKYDPKILDEQYLEGFLKFNSNGE
jgi:MFS family permease